MHHTVAFKVNHLAIRLGARLSGSHYVLACWDSEAQVWFVYGSSVPGLSLEADSQGKLRLQLLQVVPELLELNGVKRCHRKDGPGSSDGGGNIRLQTIYEENCIPQAA